MPSWIDFGRIFGATRSPKPRRNPLKNQLERFPTTKHRRIQNPSKTLIFIVNSWLQLCCVGSWNHKKSSRRPSKSRFYNHAPIWFDFESNLAQFWEGFGSQVGSNLATSRFKCWSRKVLQNGSHFRPLLRRFWKDFGFQVGTIFGWFFVDFRLLLGSWSHLGPKMVPRAVQERLRSRFGKILDPNLVDFGPQSFLIFHEKLFPSACFPLKISPPPDAT